MGTVSVGSRENWVRGTGTEYLAGQNVYRGDLALISMSSGASSTYRMYTGGTSSNSSALVKEMWSRSPVAGDQFCTGGAYGGEVCGWKVDQVNVTVKYSTGETLRNGTRGSRSRIGGGVVQGDSGGPVYTVRTDGGIAAKGIISGAGSDVLSNLMWFTDIWQAYWGLPGYLYTG